MLPAEFEVFHAISTNLSEGQLTHIEVIFTLSAGEVKTQAASAFIVELNSEFGIDGTGAGGANLSEPFSSVPCVLIKN